MDTQEKIDGVPIQAGQKTLWYQNINLKDAEACISIGLKAAARNVIAIGYYLKCIRDGRLYEEAGYSSIWEYAKEKYGFSTSTASRYMSRNDKFSKDGNSPVLDEKYRGYGKAQLQEMLSLDAETLEKVSPDMTVMEIRELRKPREIPYIEIPGQINFNISDFPGMFPESAPKEPSKNVQSGSTTFSLGDFGGEEDGASPGESRCDAAKENIICQEPESTGGEVASRQSAKAPDEYPAPSIRETGCEETGQQEDVDGCPEGIQICSRKEWGTSLEQQAAGQEECRKCWAEYGAKPEEIVPLEYDRELLELLISETTDILAEYSEEWMRDKPSACTEYQMMLQAYILYWEYKEGRKWGSDT